MRIVIFVVMTVVIDLCLAVRLRLAMTTSRSEPIGADGESTPNARDGIRWGI